MENKSVEERAREYAQSEFNLPYEKLDSESKDHFYLLERGYIKGLQEEAAARQDQGVVGTQGREEYFQMVAQLAYKEGMVRMSQNMLIAFMRTHWPVSEGEGMKWIKASDQLPAEGISVIVRSLQTGMVVKRQQMGRYDGAWGVGLEQEFQKDNTEWLYEPLPSPPQKQK